MTLVEALQLNPVKLKRSLWDIWITPDSYISHPITIVDMQADDWEMEEMTVVVSKTQLMDLVNRYIAPDFNQNKKFDNLCKDLGLN